MRLRSLHLSAFGPFTDKVLQFREDAGLHLIYGPNESGKTSSLRGLKHMLFGFPPRTNDNFLHPNPQLQVGAKFLTSTGVEKHFVRWKRNKNSLTNPQGEPVLDNELVSLLGGLKAEMFDRLHGLSHRRLVSGGKALIKVGGRVGESLFAASLGPEFQELATQLKNEYESLWAGRVNAKRPLNECIRHWEEAEDQVARLALSAEAWSEVQESHDAAQQRIGELKRELAGLDSEIENSRRVLSAAEEVSRRAELLAELKELADLPEIPSDFATDRQGLQTQVEISRQQLQAAKGELAGLEEEYQSISDESPLLEFSERVEALFKRVGVMTEYILEMPQIETEVRQCGERIELLLTKLGTTNAGERPGLPSQEWRRQVRRLAQEFSSLAQSLKEKRTRKKALEEKLKLNPEAPATELETVLRELQQAQQIARQEAGMDDVIVALLSDIRTARSSLNLDLERLPCWSGDLNELRAARVPSRNAVEEFERKLETVHREFAARVEEGRLLEHRQAELKNQLEKLSSGRDLYTLDDLQEARKSRQELWFELHESWRLGDSTLEAGRLIDNYEKATKEADEMADELMAAGERLAKFEQLRSELKEQDRLHSELSQRRLTAETEKQEVEKAWMGLWQGTGVLLESPRQMLDWLAGREEILRSATRIEHRTKELDTAKERLAAEVERLGSVLGTTFVPEKGLASALSVVDQRVEQLRERLQEHRSKMERRLETEHQLTELKKSIEDLELGQADWDKSWTNVMKHSPFNDVDPDSLEELLTTLESLATEYERETQSAQRLARLRTEVETFEREVDKLAGQLDLEVSQDKIRQVEICHRTLKEAITVEENRRRLAHDVDKKRQLVESLTKELKVQEISLSSHLKIAGTEELAEVVELEQKAARREQIRKELSLLQAALRRQLGGESLDAFCDRVLKTDLTNLPQRQADLEQKRDELSHDRETQIKKAGQLSEKLAALDGTSRSAQLKQQAAEAEAEARELLDRYVQLSLAERMLSDQIEEYRKKNEGPVLELAGRYFAQLTNGRYPSVRTGLDRRTAELVLMAVSESGREVSVEGLSDGTCDQLFLALRMAAIAGSGSNLPVIADDVLVQFDGERAASALRALVEFSELTQVILFTHLERDYRLASELNDPRVDLIEIPALGL